MQMLLAMLAPAAAWSLQPAAVAHRIACPQSPSRLALMVETENPLQKALSSLPEMPKFEMGKVMPFQKEDAAPAADQKEDSAPAADVAATADDDEGWTLEKVKNLVQIP